MRIAVIGAGISGLGAAWLASASHEVVLFEREPRLGGHSNTVDVPLPEGMVPVDTGFIVYNTAAYPNLIALFAHLGVETASTRMGFSVSLDGGRYEYSGSGLGGLFGQRANVVRPSHWRMTVDILRFFREARGLASGGADGPTLGVWLAERRFGDVFVARHILPMGAAIWSTPSRSILDFPAAAFARFFANHGLLQVTDRPEWRTVRGGSREYVSRLRGAFRGAVAAGDPVVSVRREGDRVEVVTARGSAGHFDRCLLACHADEALALLADPDADERRLLSPFRYGRNEAVLHTDPGLMPRRRRVWESWNYLAEGGARIPDRLSVTYWMNDLQPLATGTDVFVTLNPLREIDPARLIGRFSYAHPLYDQAAIAAQRELWSLQGRRSTWFAGSYFGWGFHEDGLQAGLAAAEHMAGVRRPWRVANESGRLSLPPGALDTAALEPQPA